MYLFFWCLSHSQLFLEEPQASLSSFLYTQPYGCRATVEAQNGSVLLPPLPQLGSGWHPYASVHTMALHTSSLKSWPLSLKLSQEAEAFTLASKNLGKQCLSLSQRTGSNRSLPAQGWLCLYRHSTPTEHPETGNALQFHKVETLGKQQDRGDLNVIPLIVSGI